MSYGILAVTRLDGSEDVGSHDQVELALRQLWERRRVESLCFVALLAEEAYVVPESGPEVEDAPRWRVGFDGEPCWD